MYAYLYRFLQKLIYGTLKGTSSYPKEIEKLLSLKKYDEIYDVGGSDGYILETIYNIVSEKKINYFCYDIDKVNILKGSKRYKNPNIKFIISSIDDIKVISPKQKKRLFIFIGVFHHINDKQIKNFLAKLDSADDVLALDGFFHKGIHPIGFLLKKLDRGKYIRKYEEWEKLLANFTLTKRIGSYLKYFSTVASTKGISKEILEKVFFEN